MRFIHLYLVVYFLLVAGALFALWQAQVLQQMPGEWVGLFVLIALSLGILLAVLSWRPAPTPTSSSRREVVLPDISSSSRPSELARDMVHVRVTMRRAYLVLLLLCVTGLACQEGGTVRVRKLDIQRRHRP